MMMMRQIIWPAKGNKKRKKRKIATKQQPTKKLSEFLQTPNDWI